MKFANFAGLFCLMLQVGPTWCQAGPVISTTQLPPSTFGFGYSILLQAQGGNPPYQFQLGTTHQSLPPGLVVKSDGELRWDLAGQGIFRFTVQVSDSQGRIGLRELELQSLPPFVFGEVLLGGIIGYVYEDNVVRGGSQAAYPLELFSGSLPPGLRLDPDGVIRGLPTAGGVYRFAFRSTIYPDSTASFEITILAIVGAPPSDGPPALSGAELRPGRVGERYFYQTYASGGRPPYPFSLATGALPPPLTLSSLGAISGIPHTIGTYTFGIRVTGSNGASRVADYSLQIQANSFSLGVQDLPRATISQPYSVQLQASGGRSPYQFAVTTGELPAGLSLSVGGLLSGVPRQTGNFGFVVKGRDSLDAESTQIYAVAVREPPMRFVTTSLLPLQVGVASRQQLFVSGGNPPIVFLLFGGSLPPGVELTRSGVLQGTPELPGRYTVTLHVIDGEAALLQQTFTLEVQQPLPLQLSGTFEKGAFRASYQAALQPEGGRPPYRFSLVRGTLPPGLRQDDRGLISGSPEAPGIYEWTARVSDSTNASADFLARLEIEKPHILPTALTGQHYAVDLRSVVGGGARNFSLDPTIPDTQLPAGLLLSLDGQLRGRMSIAGLYPLNFLMEQSAGQLRPVAFCFALTPWVYESSRLVCHRDALACLMRSDYRPKAALPLTGGLSLWGKA